MGQPSVILATARYNHTRREAFVIAPSNTSTFDGLICEIEGQHLMFARTLLLMTCSTDKSIAQPNWGSWEIKAGRPQQNTVARGAPMGLREMAMTDSTGGARERSGKGGLS